MLKKLTLLLIIIPTLIFAQNVNFQNKLRLAKTYERNEQWPKAEKIYRELHTLQPFNQQVIESLNNLLIKQKKYEESVKFLTTEVQRSPRNITFRGMLGSTYYTMGNQVKAEEIWDEALTVDPASTVNYRIIANYAVRHRNFDKAVSYLKKGKKLPHKGTIFNHDLAQLYFVMMQYDAATIEYCELLLKDPKQVNTAKQRINRYIEAVGAFEQTEKVLFEYYEKYDKDVFPELISSIYIRKGKFDEAFELLKKTNSTRENMIYSFAGTTLREGNFRVAALAYEYFIDKYPQSKSVPSARSNWAAALKGDVDKQLYNYSADWKPYSVHDTIGSYKYLPVIDVYAEIEKKLKNNPIGFRAIIAMAKIYFEKLQNFDKADSLLNIIRKNAPLSPANAEALMLKGKIAIAGSELNEAKSYFNKLNKDSRARPEQKTSALFYLGKISLWQKNAEKASGYMAEVSANAALDIANDALEYAMVVNTFKQDSVNFSEFCEADYLAETGKFSKAAEKYRLLGANPNLPVLNEIAEYRYGLLLIGLNRYQEAAEIFDNIVNAESASLHADDAQFILAEIYRNGLNDLVEAEKQHQKLLESFPNSLYLDRSRKILNDLSNKSNI